MESKNQRHRDRLNEWKSKIVGDSRYGDKHARKHNVFYTTLTTSNMSESEKSSCDKAIDRESNTDNQKSEEWYKVGENPCTILNPYLGNEHSKYDKSKNCPDYPAHERSKNATYKGKKLIVRWCKLDLKCYIVASLGHEWEMRG